jgi:hypothetical protein
MHIYPYDTKAVCHDRCAWINGKDARRRGCQRAETLSLGVVLCHWIRSTTAQQRRPVSRVLSLGEGCAFNREVKNSEKRRLHTECHGK